MSPLDEFIKRQCDLYDAATKPLREASQLQQALDDALNPYRRLREMADFSSVAREALRYRDWQEQLVREMRPLIADVNFTSRLAAAMIAPPALTLVEQQRRLISDLAIPSSFRSTIDSISTIHLRAFRYTSEVEGLLETLRPYADLTPEVPDEDTLAALRERVHEVVSAKAERITAAVRSLLRWVVENARRIGQQRVSFILFVIIYPLLLTVYQDELKRAFHRAPAAKRKVVEREVVTAVVQRVPVAALRNVRYVARPVLNVRVTSRRDSSKVGELHFGDVIVVLRSTKDWTLVEFDVGDAELRGWVLTRGLKKFNVERRSR